MQKQKTQTQKKLLDEKIKVLPVEQQNYIKGLIDGVLMNTVKKEVVSPLR